jgi:hypothetical protein
MNAPLQKNKNKKLQAEIVLALPRQAFIIK